MKYKGSKKRIMKYLNPIFSEYKDKYKLHTFIDVFCGGANVATNLTQGWDNIIINDFDPILVALLEEVKNYPEHISFYDTPTKETYDAMRNIVKNKTFDMYDVPLYHYGVILFFGSFNARAYGGNYGATTITKTGIKRDYFQEAKRNILKQDFSKINLITNLSYKQIEFKEKSLIYLDPPYKNTTGYAGSKFDHSLFWEWVRELSKKHIVLISELKAPKDFEVIWEKETIHGQNQENKLKKTEKLFKWKGDKNE